MGASISGIDKEIKFAVQFEAPVKFIYTSESKKPRIEISITGGPSLFAKLETFSGTEISNHVFTYITNFGDHVSSTALVNYPSGAAAAIDLNGATGIDQNGNELDYSAGVLFNSLTKSAISTCPDTLTQRYIHVPKNPDVGVDYNFCVMKFEAKDGGGANLKSNSVGSAVTALLPDEFFNRCTVSDLDPEIIPRMISNAEWMTIARNIERQALNWTSGVVNSEVIFKGHSNESTFGFPLLAVADESNGYEGTGNNSSEPIGGGKEQKRTHILSTGEKIWDF